MFLFHPGVLEKREIPYVEVAFVTVANSPACQGTRVIKNLFSGTVDRVKEFNGVFDKLMQEFRDNAEANTLVVVHWIWDHLEGLRGFFFKSFR